MSPYPARIRARMEPLYQSVFSDDMRVRKNTLRGLPLGNAKHFRQTVKTRRGNLTGMAKDIPVKAAAPRLCAYDKRQHVIRFFRLVRNGERKSHNLRDIAYR